MKLEKAIQRHIERGKQTDPAYEEKFWKGYEAFELGVLLKQARQEKGLTQEQIATRLKTTKSAISRIENHTIDIKLSTLEKFAQALGKKLTVVME